MRLVKCNSIPDSFMAHLKPSDVQAKRGCRHCHERGFTGIWREGDRKGGQPMLCRCAVADLDILQERANAKP